jgi:hypothetical protein
MIAVMAAVLALAVPNAHHKKHHHPAPMKTAIASWYYDAGPTASGRHYQYGFASLMFGSAWGKKVLFCYHHCIVGRLDDHGPYVSGRLFDLNQTLKAATGCTDLCHVRYRVQ